MRLYEINIHWTNGTLKTQTVKVADGSINYKFVRSLRGGFGMKVTHKIKGGETLKDEYWGGEYPTYGFFDEAVIPMILPAVIKHMEGVQEQIGSRAYYHKLASVFSSVMNAHAIYSKFVDKGRQGKLDALDKLQDEDLEDYIDL